MKLKTAIKRLETEYERGKGLAYVRNPLAWALYRVWKEADRLGEDEPMTRVAGNYIKINKEVNMDLKDTIEMMNSSDYKERFKAEYYQTKIRYEKLHRMCIKYEAGTLDFKPNCSLELLKEQKAAMGRYLGCLEVRAEIEGVTL